MRGNFFNSLIKYPFLVDPSYPKDYRENLIWRAKILKKAAHSPEYLSQTKQLFHSDIVFAFNAFFYTLDVRKRPFHQQPFCTYPYQDDVLLQLVDAINTKKDVVIEKTRDMGVSWLVILTYLWCWLDPKGGADFLLGSRIEDYVDKKGDMRTLLEKARFALYLLPSWLRPKGFIRTKHDNFMRLVNPETGASITGESNNPNFSTGGRYISTLFDEFGKWEGSDEGAWTAAGDATPCRVAVSTPFGMAGKFYALTTDGRTKKLVLHWSLHPEKAYGLACLWPRKEDEEVTLTSPWYVAQCARRTPVEIAQELDIDYLGSGNPVFVGKASQRIIHLLEEQRPLQLSYFPDTHSKTLIETNVSQSDEGIICCWNKPDKEKSYIFAIDVAEGKGDGDYSIIKVLNRHTLDCDCSYYGHVDEVELAIIIFLLWNIYGNDRSWWAVETNGPGLATFDLCVGTYNLPNAFMMPRMNTTTEQISHIKGWRTDMNSRQILISNIKEWLLAGSSWVNGRCLGEMTTFIRSKTGKPQAKAGTHDDEVIAWGIALSVHELCPFDDYKAPIIKDELGLPINTVGAQRGWKKIDEPTREELCLRQVQKERSNLIAQKQFFQDTILEAL